ncbi:MAG TPA: hypothetical protein VL329_02090 [Nitrospiraceae bacterium]|nr:hypothetical protein [Nitrospiraceae bacterium]
MMAFIHAVVISLAVLEVGCGLFLDQEMIYLQSAQDRETQQAVRDRLGPPLWIVPRSAGETVWVYQITQREKGGNNILDIVGFWCDEYVLTFDQQGVLRHWEHKSQKHRDPPSPTNCVTNGFMSQASSFNWQYRLTRW